MARLFEHAVGLGSRLGPVLYQLPGAASSAICRGSNAVSSRCCRAYLTLDDAAGCRCSTPSSSGIPPGTSTDTFALLAEHGVALCLHDMAGSAIDAPDVGPFTYVRFHGAAGKYFGSYGDDVLGRLGAAAGRRVAARAATSTPISTTTRMPCRRGTRGGSGR